MRFALIGSLSKKLALLVILSILPAIAILLYSGIKQRQRSIEHAKSKLFQLTNTIAKAQQQIALSSKNVLRTLSILPEIQTLDTQACNKIFKDILMQNTTYSNIALSDLNGNVIASGKDFSQTNLSDRKHFREALENKSFSAGEYIVSRVGVTIPSFAFAFPVLDKNGGPKAMLTMAIKLDNFAHYIEILKLPEKSFLSITDYQGIRIFYYPDQTSTNPVGKPIKTSSWQMAKTATDSDIFINTGSDQIRRVFAFKKISLTPKDAPYLYAWAGIPEDYILGPANKDLIRNLLLMLFVTLIAFIISFVIGKNTDALILNLEQASKEIRTLRGIIPICSFCKNIRNDEGYYEQIEGYIQKNSHADFSHTVCPACLKKNFPKEFQDKIIAKEKSLNKT